MDVKQEINLKALIYIYLTSVFFIDALSEATEKLTIRVTLVQEVGIDTMVWEWNSSRCHRHYLSTYAWSISYVHTDLAKFKGLLIKIKVIKGFQPKVKVLKDCNQIKGF